MRPGWARAEVCGGTQLALGSPPADAGRFDSQALAGAQLPSDFELSRSPLRLSRPGSPSPPPRRPPPALGDQREARRRQRA